MIEIFEPNKKQLIRMKSWFIKPHRVRYAYTREDGSKFPECCECHKPFEYYDLAFYCITQPIRIVGYASYAKICFDCGIKKLAAVTPPKQLPQLKAMELEYKQ